VQIFLCVFRTYLLLKYLLQKPHFTLLEEKIILLEKRMKNKKMFAGFIFNVMVPLFSKSFES